MRIRISHETRYRYDAPTSGVIQTLRLTPRNHDGHYVVHWRIDVSEDCLLDAHEDAFGNITHTFTAEGPFAALGVQFEGEGDVQDTAGTVPDARASRRRTLATPGPRRMCPRSVGSRSTRPTASARPRRMCASRSGSIISALRRCAAHAAAAAPRAWPSGFWSIRRRGRYRADR